MSKLGTSVLFFKRRKHEQRNYSYPHVEIVKGTENPQGTVKDKGRVGVRVQIWNP